MFCRKNRGDKNRHAFTINKHILTLEYSGHTVKKGSKKMDKNTKKHRFLFKRPTKLQIFHRTPLNWEEQCGPKFRTFFAKKMSEKNKWTVEMAGGALASRLGATETRHSGGRGPARRDELADHGLGTGSRGTKWRGRCRCGSEGSLGRGSLNLVPNKKTTPVLIF